MRCAGAATGLLYEAALYLLIAIWGSCTASRLLLPYTDDM